MIVPDGHEGLTSATIECVHDSAGCFVSIAAPLRSRFTRLSPVRHSVGRDFDFRSLLNYDVGEQKVSTETLKRGDEKVAHQSRFTNKALQMLVTERQKKASS